MIFVENLKDKERNWCQKGHNDDKIVRTLLSRELTTRFDYDDCMDVDNLQECRKYDIDLILFSSKKGTVSVEAKADDFPMFYNKKYIFCETISNTVKNTPGCIYTSSCNFFCYYCIKYDTYILISKKNLINYIDNNMYRLTKKRARTLSPDNKKILYYTEGVLVDIDELIKYKLCECYKSNIRYLDIKKELGL